MPPRQLTERSIILDAKRNRPAEVDAGARLRLELELVLGPRQVALERGIEEQLHTRHSPLENRRQFEGARALPERRTRCLVLDAEAHVDGQPPLLGRAQPRAQTPALIA